MLRIIFKSFLIGAALLTLTLASDALAQKSAAKDNFEEGIKFKEEGSLFQAKEKFEQALEIDPGYHIARVELAGTYADLNMLDEAVDELAKLKKITKPLRKLHTYKGLVHYKLGLDVWTKLAQNHPEYMYKDDGKVSFIKKEVSAELQIDKLKKKINQDTTNLEARYQLRGMYYDVALQELQLAIKEAPKDTLANLTLGLAYLERGKKDLALKQKQVLEKFDQKSAADLQAMIDFVEQGKKELEDYLKEGDL